MFWTKKRKIYIKKWFYFKIIWEKVISFRWSSNNIIKLYVFIANIKKQQEAKIR